MRMRMNKRISLVSLLVFACCLQAGAQSITDLFGKGGAGDVLDSVVSQLDVVPKNIEGEWSYSGSAVQFSGDNVLMNAASGLAVGSVESKIDDYLAAVGIKDGIFSYTFKADGSFLTSFNGMDFPGSYTFSKEEKTLVLEYGKVGKFEGVSLKTNVSVGTKTLQLLFNADKLLNFLTEISAVAGGESSQLSMLSSLLEQYDGMMLGFELTRVSRR